MLSSTTCCNLFIFGVLNIVWSLEAWSWNGNLEFSVVELIIFCNESVVGMVICSNFSTFEGFGFTSKQYTGSINSVVGSFVCFGAIHILLVELIESWRIVCGLLVLIFGQAFLTYVWGWFSHVEIRCLLIWFYKTIWLVQVPCYWLWSTYISLPICLVYLGWKVFLFHWYL